MIYVLAKQARTGPIIDRELRAHLELEAEEQQDAGLTQDQARYAARRAFGNVTLTNEEARQMWGWTTLDLELG